MAPDWKSLADGKRDAILASIPQKWRIEKLPSNEEQKDVTGAFVQQYLSKREVEITETDVVGIAKQTSSGNWTAVEVTEAFCHRASLAHQLVCTHTTKKSPSTDDDRPTAYMKPSSTPPSRMPKPWTSITPRTRRQWDPCMAYLLV